MSDIREQIDDLKSVKVIHGPLRSWPIARCEEFADTMEKLLAENAKLAESLLEALEWNWLDEDFNEVMFDTFTTQAKAAVNE